MKKAQALIIVILLINFFLIIVLVMANLMLKEFAIQGRMSDSMAAYYAAESGIEKAVLKINQNSSNLNPSNPNLANVGETTFGGFPTPTWEYTIDPTTDPMVVKGTGKKNNVSRVIQATVSKTVGTNGIYWPQNWKEISP